MNGRRTCDVYLLVSGSFELFIKQGTLPGPRLDYVFSATEELCISNASGMFSCKVTLNVPLLATDSSSSSKKMFGCGLRSDTETNHLFKRLARVGLINYEAVMVFCGGPCYAVVVEPVNDPDRPGIGVH